MTHEATDIPSPLGGRHHALLCYLVPLLVLGLFCSPLDPGGSIFWRNWLRAGCGPAVQVMWWAGFPPNDLCTYAVAFSLLWLAWLSLIVWTPLHRSPRVVHATMGFVWCFGGCGLTAAI